MHMIGKILAFRGNEEYFSAESALVEVTEVNRTGVVELGFDMPNKSRVYVSFKLQDLISCALIECPNKDD